MRFLQPTDRAACVPLICHSFMYHNSVDAVYNYATSAFASIYGGIFDHCLTQQLSFVIEDCEFLRQQQPAFPDWNYEKEEQPLDHDAHLQRVQSAIVGVVLNHDSSHRLDWSRLGPCDHLKDTFAVFHQLGANDLRASPSHPLHRLYHPPPYEPTHAPGTSLHCFILVTDCQHKQQKLAAYLSAATYYYGRQLGFDSLRVEATHPATLRIFTAPPMRGVVTHRVRLSDVVNTTEDGKEWKRWAAVDDEVSVVHVDIDQSLLLSLLPHQLSLTRLAPASSLPSWTSSVFTSITLTSKELSVLTLTSCTPPLSALPPSSLSRSGYRALIVAGCLDLNQVGVLHRLLSPLRVGRVAVLAVSSYDTDALIVREEDVDVAVRLLEADGHKVRFAPVQAEGSSEDGRLEAETTTRQQTEQRHQQSSAPA
jgi:hypothetical protein